MLFLNNLLDFGKRIGYLRGIRYVVSSFLMSFFFLNTVFSQEKPYFQQEVNYNITAKLDDQKHILTGNIDMAYTNNAPEPLSMLYILLQPNAYKNKNTAFAKQQMRNGLSRFYFAESSDMGSIGQLDFQVDGQKVEVEIDRQNPDIAKIKLATPIQPKVTVKITTPFTYKIPLAFSRGGRIKQQYLMTQWYPKPAVYDRDGWHPMPYLDQGEFYAEFGNYDVKLTLPDNYVVAATGYLQTGSEWTFLSKKSIDTEGGVKAYKSGKKAAEIWSDSIPKSSDNFKTVRYTAQNVHDFAWFADKRFLVMKSDTTLASGKKVDTWTFFNPKHVKNWKNSTHFVNRAVRFYSDNVGEYPHPHATAVMADDGFGGGMEYPMITVLSGLNDEKSVDGTIAHEVGHNWFQGILANNERQHAWLDEGLNSFYDQRYMKTYYGDNGELIGLPKFLTKKSDYNETNAVLQLLMWLRRDQAPETPSDKLTFMNYGIGVYQKPARALQILERHVGTEKFDEVMKAYFEKWKFKHPQPADFRKMWESDPSVGDVSWLFDGLLNSTKPIDYQIVGREKSDKEWIKIGIKNAGEIAAPFTVSAIKNDSIVWTTRLGGVAAGETTTVLIPQKSQPDMVTIDAQHQLLEVNRTNNNLKIGGIFPKIEPLSIRVLPQLDNSRRTNFYVTPYLAANAYDKIMLGAWLHNGLLPARNWHISLAPSYSIGAKALSGLGNVDYSFFVGNNKVSLGIGARQFSWDYNKKFDETKLYRRLTPSLQIDFLGKPTSLFSSNLTLRHLNIRQQDLAFDTSSKYLGLKWETPTNITELSYAGTLKNALGNTNFRLAIEHQAYTAANATQRYVRLGLSVDRAILYQPKKRVYVRAFIGKFLQNTGRDWLTVFGSRSRGSLGLVSNGLSDYRFDGLYFGRNHDSSFVSQQIDPYTEGGFKFVPPQGSRFAVGFSNDFVAALNLKLDLPVSLPAFLQLKPYFDMGYFKDRRSQAERASTNFLASGGIAWELMGGAVQIYAPLYFSGKSADEDPNSFRALMTRRGKFHERMTFSLDLKRVNPRKFLNNIQNLF
jgi:Peptidase family M1 domain